MYQILVQRNANLLFYDGQIIKPIFRRINICISSLHYVNRHENSPICIYDYEQSTHKTYALRCMMGRRDGLTDECEYGSVEN